MRNKFFFASVFALILFISIHTPLKAAEQVSLYWDKKQLNVGVDKQVTSDIIIDTAGKKVAGVGAVVKFDPNIIQAVGVSTQGLFKDYPLKTVDNELGIIKISGIVGSINELYSGQGTFATVTWKGIESGASIIQYVFEPGSTIDSNVAVTYGNGDALESVQDLYVGVTEDGPGEIAGPTNNQDDKTNIDSAKLDPYGPLPNQAPKTSLDNQPESVVEVSQKGAISRNTLLVFAASAIFIVLMLLAIWFARRKAKSQTTIVVPK